MNESEAKAMLQEKLKCMEQKDLKCIGKGCDGDCDNCHLNYEQGNWGEQKKAMEVAIKALGLTEERTPDLEGDGYSDGHLVYDTWICPNCEKHYEMEYEEHDHCPNCGQAIDWEGIKDAERNDDDKDSDKSSNQVRTYRHPLADAGTYIL